MAKFDKADDRTNRKGKGRGRSHGKGAQFDRAKDTREKGYVGKGDTDYRMGRNDPTWYTRNNQLTSDAGRIAFTWPVGSPVDFFANGVSSKKLTIPGVMSLQCAPTLGVSKDNSSVINIAARNIYSWVRHMNSGHANYDSPDLMLYLLGMDSIYTMYAWMVRLYGVMRLYSQRNRYYPRVIVEAMGADFDDILSNLADFRYFINQYAVKASSLCVPNVMTYYTRHIWMYSGLFTDGVSAKSQTYMYNPAMLWKYNEVDDMGKLEAIDFNWFLIQRLNFATIRSIATEILNAMMLSEDINIMSGDILKAYGEPKMIHLDPISESFTITPEVNNPEILEQFHNATILGNGWNANDWSVTQDVTGALLFNPKLVAYERNVTCPRNAYYGKRVLAAEDESPSPDRVLTMSRLTVICKDSDNDEEWNKMEFDSCGSEVVVSGRLFYFNDSYEINSQPVFYAMPTTIQPNGIISNYCVKSRVQVLMNLTVFGHHPMVAIFKPDAEPSSDTPNPGLESWGTSFDVDNYAIVDSHDLAKMHETSLLSMFAVPYYGSADAAK